MNNEKLEVIIDGANLLHDDRGIVMKDDDGERIWQSRPERLNAAISFCEKKGWKTTAILKQMSYYVASQNTESDWVGDMNLLDHLISEKKVMLISKKKEDIYFINLAIQRNAYIITRDGFKEEREKYPELDWEDIDNRTLRNHAFMGDNFVLPGLPDRTADLPIEVSYKDFMELNERVEFLENKIQLIEDTYKIQKATLIGQAVEDMNPKEVVLSLLDSSLKGGKEVTLNGFQGQINRAIQGDKAVNHMNSMRRLRQRLGYSKSRGFLSWLIELSGDKVKHKTKEGKVYIHYG
ncbi:hypothetical protein OAV29_03970 [Candidatus Poseidoniaceae archaeon]|nr:hypothetical protein [Candidatus Poseidoniaceae archaeon]